MAQRIVDLFEAIHVQHQQRRQLVFFDRVSNDVMQVFAEEKTIGQPRQRIKAG